MIIKKINLKKRILEKKIPIRNKIKFKFRLKKKKRESKGFPGRSHSQEWD